MQEIGYGLSSFQVHLHYSCAWACTSALLLLTLYLNLAFLVLCLRLGTLSGTVLTPTHGSRLHLESRVHFWILHYKKDVEVLEHVQRKQQSW